METTFRALVSDGKGLDSIKIKKVETSFLPENDVIIQVHFSALNYKDALSAKGHPGITRNYPHIPGIDAAGIILEDKSGKFQIGEKVLVTGYDLGMNSSGGFSERISVPAEWVHLIPVGLSLEESMILGTAGITAAIALEKMEALMRLNSNNLSKKNILVTGASGGVGSISIAQLKKAGYLVTALSGKTELTNWLKSLGADEVINRKELLEASNSSKPLLPSRFDGCIDTVGGEILESVLKVLHKEAPIAVCGNAGGVNFSTSVFPFILRGNSIVGVDSAHIDKVWRERLWQKLATEWKPDSLSEIKRVISFQELPNAIRLMLDGGSHGRVLLNCMLK